MEIVRDWNGGTHVDSSSSIIITETEISSDQVKILLQACHRILSLHFRFKRDQAKSGSPPSKGAPQLATIL